MPAAAMCMSRLSTLPIATLTALLLMLATSVTAAPKVLLQDHFDSNSNDFAATSAWQNKYCNDTWTAALNGGVIASGDHGCTCGTGCDFGVFTQGKNHCINSQATDNVLVRGDAAWTNYVFSVRMRNVDNDTMGVIFRYKNTANYYAVWLSRDIAPSVSGACDSKLVGASLVRVASQTGGGKATLLASSKTTYQIGKVHIISVTALGDQLTVRFDANADGKLDPATETLFSVKDGTHKAGSIGLYTYQNGAGEAPCNKGGCWFDDVLVQTVEAEPIKPPEPKDKDKDKLDDDKDNCPDVPNPDQQDTDGDKLGDACDDDADGDGISNVDEALLGSNPLDQDSDDDGVLDGEEAQPGADTDGDGIPNVMDPDSDGDGLNDGLEAGVTKPHKDTDISKGHFVADLDPTTHTSTVKKDTDGDGRADGIEDTNRNGRVDACESDPLVPDVPPCGGTVDAGGGVTADAGTGRATQDAGATSADSEDPVGATDAPSKTSGGPITLKTVGDDQGGCSAGPARGTPPAGAPTLWYALLLLMCAVGLILRRSGQLLGLERRRRIRRLTRGFSRRV